MSFNRTTFDKNVVTRSWQEMNPVFPLRNSGSVFEETLQNKVNRTGMYVDTYLFPVGN